jgi:hypothetical protein
LDLGEHDCFNCRLERPHNRRYAGRISRSPPIYGTSGSGIFTLPSAC